MPLYHANEIDDNVIACKLRGENQKPISRFDQITFTRDESGNVSALVLHQHGRDQTAARVE